LLETLINLMANINHRQNMFSLKVEQGIQVMSFMLCEILKCLQGLHAMDQS